MTYVLRYGDRSFQHEGLIYWLLATRAPWPDPHAKILTPHLYSTQKHIIAVSSAYILVYICLSSSIIRRTIGRSFVYIINRSGQRMLPYGTPVTTERGSDTKQGHSTFYQRCKTREL